MMTEELEQLLKNLQLRRVLEVYFEQLKAERLLTTHVYASPGCYQCVGPVGLRVSCSPTLPDGLRKLAAWPGLRSVIGA
jgi:hypothetical protein